MARKKRVLFVCTGASCRSQIAAGWAGRLAGEHLEAFAAGTDPKGLNPGAVAVMREVGVDISHSRSASVHEFLEVNTPDFVIAVCSEAGRNCPDFPSTTPTLRWSFDDPAAFDGSQAQAEALFRRVRDEIRERVSRWIITEFGVMPFHPLPSERTA